MEPKLYPCKECGRKVQIRSKGLCPGCREKQRRADGTLPVYKNTIKSYTKKNTDKRKKERGCLSAFFEHHITHLSKYPVSLESGDRIYQPSAMNIAHVLPKRKSGGFPSVQCHLSNAVYLTVDEHTKFDKLMDERDYETLEKEFPNSWNMICVKIIKLLEIASETNKMSLSLDEYLKSK